LNTIKAGSAGGEGSWVSGPPLLGKIMYLVCKKYGWMEIVQGFLKKIPSKSLSKFTTMH